MWIPQGKSSYRQSFTRASPGGGGDAFLKRWGRLAQWQLSRSSRSLVPTVVTEVPRIEYSSFLGFSHGWVRFMSSDRI
jgi:hypothetical protein